MKHLLLIALIISVVSCSNNDKAVIVEQIKAYKDSIGVVQKQEAELLDAVMKVQEQYVGQQAIDSVNALEAKQAAIKAELLTKKAMYQSKIDSLELELKKY